MRQADDTLIIDVGMHTGQDTAFYLAKGFRVVAIEANPELVARGKEKFAGYVQAGQLRILNVGITETEGTFDFYVNSQKDDWSSFDKEWNKTMWQAGTVTRAVAVPCMPMNQVIADVGVPYYLKVDIEGNDLVCLKGLHAAAGLPRYVSVELPTFNNLPGREVDYLEILCHLGVLGYRKFQVVDQSRNATTKCPNPPREGRYVDYRFDGHSSGLFGKELGGQWLSLDEVAYWYLYYVKNHHLPPRPARRSRWQALRHPNRKYYEGLLHVNGWFDVHATF